jgi:hypothetical protein
MQLADRMPTQHPRPTAHADSAIEPMPSIGDVMARISAEVSGPLTAALNRVLALANSGSIDRPGLQALRDEIDGARRVGLRGQQIARLAGGLVQPSVERIDLARLLREVLTEQALQATSHAVGSRQTLGAAEVMGDASLLHAVLQAAADWSVVLARSSVEWRLDIKPWPAHARVHCRFAHGAADLAAAGDDVDTSGSASRRLAHADTLDWLLLQYTAHMGGVIVQRDDGPSHTTLVLEFINTVNDTVENHGPLDSAPAGTALPLIAGSQVLVLAARRDARQQVRAAMHGHDIFIDYVPSVAAARDYCEDGTPQVLLFESSFDSEALRNLFAQFEARAPGVALIEIVPEGHGCETSSSTGHRITRVGADGLRQMLASVMLLELARRH